jgi:glutathione synthase/RimK-type ligase-like ATP-grasp enzyme
MAGLSSSRIIIKPLTGSGGEGILIFEKGRPIPLKYPFLAQELIEVKRGVKNFVSGPHDLRVIIINEKPFYSFLRIPEKNKLISNLSQGGTIRVVPLDKLPRIIFPFLEKIQKKLKHYGEKLYSVDMILDDNGRPWIIELNSRPGLILEKEELPYQEYFFDNVINFLSQTR